MSVNYNFFLVANEAWHFSAIIHLKNADDLQAKLVHEISCINQGILKKNTLVSSLILCHSRISVPALLVCIFRYALIFCIPRCPGAKRNLSVRSPWELVCLSSLAIDTDSWNHIVFRRVHRVELTWWNRIWVLDRWRQQEDFDVALVASWILISAGLVWHQGQLQNAILVLINNTYTVPTTQKIPKRNNPKNTMKVELSLHASKLKNATNFGTSDPYAVVTQISTQAGNKPEVLGKTEVWVFGSSL